MTSITIKMDYKNNLPVGQLYVPKIEDFKAVVDNILKTTSFDKMKEMENNFGFEEADQNKINLGNKKKFFHLGKDNKWETFLERDEADEIENAFRDEMKELKYL